MIAASRWGLTLVSFAAVSFGQAPEDVETSTSLAAVGGGAAARIGVPVTWSITVAGDGAVGAELAGEGDLGLGWEPGGGPPRRTPGRSAEGRPFVRFDRTLLPLEGGALSTPPVDVALADGSTVVAPAATLEVAHALAEGEDAPRPLAGFRDVDGQRVGDPRVALAVLLALVALPVLAVYFVRRRRRAPRATTPPPEPSPIERIGALDPERDPVAAMSALGPLLRRALDSARGVDLSASTDEEWARALEAASDGPAARVQEAAQLVRELEIVRFGGATPTTFAAKSAVERAQAIVEGWSGAQASEPQGVPA